MNEVANLGKPLPEEELSIWFIKIKSVCGTYTEICADETGYEDVLCGMTKEEAEVRAERIKKTMLGKPSVNSVEVIKL